MLRQDRKQRIRKRLRSRSRRLRLSVFRSLKYIYAQIIDDQKGLTLVSARGKNPEAVGREIAAKAVKAKIAEVMFDRGQYQYHGRIRSLAEAARKGGLKF